MQASRDVLVSYTSVDQIVFLEALLLFHSTLTSDALWVGALKPDKGLEYDVLAIKDVVKTQCGAYPNMVMM